MKKLISILLVLAMVLALAPMAFASEETTVEEDIIDEIEEVEEEPAEPIEEPVEEPIVEEPAKDGGTIYTYYASDLKDWQDLDSVLPHSYDEDGTVVLIVDVDKTIGHFYHAPLSLTITGDHTLTMIPYEYGAPNPFDVLGDYVTIDTEVIMYGNGLYHCRGLHVTERGSLTLESWLNDPVIDVSGDINIEGYLWAESLYDAIHCTKQVKLGDGIEILSPANAVYTNRDGLLPYYHYETPDGTAVSTIEIGNPAKVKEKEYVLTRLEVTVPHPIVGQKAGDVKPFVSNSTACSVVYFRWRDMTEERNLNNDDTFQAEHEYTVYMNVDCMEGYAVLAHTGAGFYMTFTGTASINGEPAELISELRDPEDRYLDPHFARLYYDVGTPSYASIPGGVQTVGKVVHFGEVMECRLLGEAASIPASKLHYQWQTAPSGTDDWTDVPGATGASWQTPSGGTETIVARVVVTADGYTGQLVSNKHAINVNSSQPSEISGGVSIDGTVAYHGDTISCSLTGAAASIPASKIHYQWQMSPDKTSWTSVTGAVGASWQTPAGGSSASYARVIVTADGYTGQLVSDPRALNVNSSTASAIEGSVTIKQTSESETSFELGKVIKGTYRNKAGIVSTAPSLRYQWQRSLNNANWTDISGATGSEYTPTDADEGYWLRMVVTSKYSVGELYSDSKQIAPEPPTLTFAADAKSVKASGDWTGLYARVALVLDNGGVSGLYITQATINDDGTILIPEFKVPGLKVKGVNVSLVPTLADIQSSTPNVVATVTKMLT